MADELPPFNPLPIRADTVIFKQTGDAQHRTPDPKPMPMDWDQPQPEPRKRHSQRGDFLRLCAIKDTLRMSEAEFAGAIGYSGNAMTDWRRTGTCPAVAVMAAEYLFSQRQPPEMKQPNYRFLLVSISSAGQINTREMDQPQEFSFMGRSYLCWPIFAEDVKS